MARQIMGTTVIGGMLAATSIAVFIIPVLFVTVEKVATKGTGCGRHSEPPMPEQEPRRRR